MANDVLECNCSICTTNGYLFIYAPNSNIEFTKGAFDELKVLHLIHYICRGDTDLIDQRRIHLARRQKSHITSAARVVRAAWREVSVRQSNPKRMVTVM